jgi:hypothetical protein
MEVTAEAGCHLGRDPRDPTGRATWERSLLCQLEAKGWALPDLGGVTHQTVSGFLMTGSSGGSVTHSIEAAVARVRLVDGTGRVHELTPADDRFFAVLCSMGLLGVVSSVTFRCVPRYDIVGTEQIRDEDACAYDVYADGEPGLEGFFRRAEYARLMWWPQDGVRRLVTWQARRMRPEDYTERTGPPAGFRPKPYLQMGELAAPAPVAQAVNLATQAAAGLVFDTLAVSRRLADPFLTRSRRLDRRGAELRAAFGRRVVPPAIRTFVPPGDQTFWDRWYDGLPMDNQMSERFLPTTFTEIWVPLDRAGEALRALRAWFDRDGYEATGAYLCEIYAAKATRGWLHPGHGRDSLRIDPFWFTRNPGDPVRGWFRGYWEALRPFGYRLHWGKLLPADPALGCAYLRRQYPRWDDFSALRRELDPGDRFLTRHWAGALGIGG